MAWRAYNTVNGQLLGETASTGARPLDYQLDALSSVVGTIKANGTLENTYRYAGYGQHVSKTGTGPDPNFLWVGGWGYRASSLMIYVRERSLPTTFCYWTSVDVLWPNQGKYAYCNQNPAAHVDYYGLKPSNLANCRRISLMLLVKLVGS